MQYGMSKDYSESERYFLLSGPLIQENTKEVKLLETSEYGDFIVKFFHSF